VREPGTDRRAMRTRQLLIQALADLMHTKRYSAISVQEIADRADVGRSTFYAHFTDKDDLMVQGLRHMVGTLDPGPAGATNTLVPSLGLFHHVAGAKDLKRSLAHGGHLSMFYDVLQAELSSLFLDRLAPRLPEGPTRIPPPLLASMVAAMLVTAVRTWIEADAGAPAEDVNRSFTIAAEAALRAGLRPAG
jgi:AcrR family transcriptional regulator